MSIACREIALSNRDSLDDVSRHPALPSVVKACGPGIGMAGQKLHVLLTERLAEKNSSHTNRRKPTQEGSVQATMPNERLKKFRRLVGFAPCPSRPGPTIAKPRSSGLDEAKSRFGRPRRRARMPKS